MSISVLVKTVGDSVMKIRIAALVSMLALALATFALVRQWQSVGGTPVPPVNAVQVHKVDRGQSEGIVPKLDQCELAIGELKLKPANISEDSMLWRDAGDWRIAVDEKGIRGVSKRNSDSQWTATPLKEIELAWLRNDMDIGYLVGWMADDKSRDERHEKPLVVRRLNLKSGKWLQPLSIEPDPKVMNPQSIEEIADVLQSSSGVVVLTSVKRPTDKSWVPFTGIAYRLISFKNGKTAWSHTYTTSGEMPRLGVALWAAREPEAASSRMAPLTLLRSGEEESVIVCAGPLEPVRCVEIQSGKEKWSLARLWEYRRGFIGPSVWSHYLSRHGLDRFHWEEKEKGEVPVKKEGNANASEVNCLVGGPVVLPQKNDEPRIFLATGTAPRSYSTYLTECTVYEITTDGEPITRTTLPRVVQGTRHQIVDGGVVWACGGGAFVKLKGTSSEDMLDVWSPGSHDRLSEIDWYRQLAAKTPDAWLTSDPAGDPLSFSAEQAFRVRTGGYVKTPKDHIYHFPIAAIDLHTGQESSLLLSVPFDGDLPKPVSNYSGRALPDGTTSFATMGPYHLAITAVRALPGQLEVTLGMDNWHRTLTFELPKRGGK